MGAQYSTAYNRLNKKALLCRPTNIYNKGKQLNYFLGDSPAERQQHVTSFGRISNSLHCCQPLKIGLRASNVGNINNKFTAPKTVVNVGKINNKFAAPKTVVNVGNINPLTPRRTLVSPFTEI